MPQEYVAPSEIDGSPAEVERKAIDQIGDLFNEVAVQVRSAYMTRQLDKYPSTTPETLTALWEESDRRAEVQRIEILIAEL